MSTIAGERADRDTDSTFALVLGLYLALLAVGPVVAATALWLGLGDDAVLYVVSLLTVAVVTGLGWLGTWRRPGLAVALGRSRARWFPALLAGGFGIAAILAAPAFGVLALVAFFFGLLAAVVPGPAMAFAARSRYTDVVLAGTTEYESFTAGWPDRARNRLVLALLPVFATGCASMAAAFWFEHDTWLWSIGQFLLPAATMPFNRTQAHTYSLSDAGIVRSIPFGKTVATWDRFDGYSSTDEAIVLHRHWDLDARFARDQIDDPETVLTTIDRFLPRRD
ncbi:hypothetical protein [Haloarcula pelagica]|uniref:hypothetical protein n=1 Tax=Haloarcula pelagica TaxID=3033389 RepID=UPI0024C32004|nr:hypothetical protein [Halomicroarcula sp. YJ-61-S]